MKILNITGRFVFGCHDEWYQKRYTRVDY